MDIEMKKVNVLLAVIIGMSVGTIQAMNDENLISLPSPKVIERTLRSAGYSEIVDLSPIQFALGDKILDKQTIINTVNKCADEVPEGLLGLCSDVLQPDRDKIVQIIFTLNRNKPENNIQRNAKVVLSDDEHLIALPDSKTIKYQLKSAGFSEIVDLEKMHIVLGSKILSRKRIIEIVNAHADEVPKGLGGLVNDISQAERDQIVQIIFKLDRNKQSKL